MSGRGRSGGGSFLSDERGGRRDGGGARGSSFAGGRVEGDLRGGSGGRGGGRGDRGGGRGGSGGRGGRGGHFGRGGAGSRGNGGNRDGGRNFERGGIPSNPGPTNIDQVMTGRDDGGARGGSSFAGGRGGGDVRGAGGRGGGGRGGRRGDFGRGGPGNRGSGGGRDRGSNFVRGGRPSNPGPTNIDEVKTNILLATVTESFEFYQYTIHSSDKNDHNIESFRQRADLFTKGFWNGILKDRTTEEKDELKRFVFFGGSFFFSAKPIEGLEKSKLPVLLVDGTDTDGSIMSVEQVIRYKAPKGTLPIDDIRCSYCNKTFTSKKAVLQHCQATGHDPNYIKPGENDALHALHSTPDVFLSYVNLALDKAMREHLLRWGDEYYDRDAPIAAKDGNGQSLDVHIFEAISLSFGLLRANGAKVPRLALTCDLRAKVIRTKSVLDSIYEGRRNPNDVSEIDSLKTKWIGQIVIYKRDKKCYTIIDLDFDNSADSKLVADKNISHTDYFRQKGVTLEYPDKKPLIVVEGRHKKKIFLPAELVAGNALDPKVRAMLPRVASFKPDVRNNAFEKVVKTFLKPSAHKSTGGALLPAIGIILEDQRLMAKAQLLSSPEILVAGAKVPPNSENWAGLLSKATYNIDSNQATQLKGVVFYPPDLAHCAGDVYSKIIGFANNSNTHYRFSEQPKLVEVGELERPWRSVKEHLGTSSSQTENVFVLYFCKPRAAMDAAYPVVKHLLTSNGYLSQFVNFKTCDHASRRDEKMEKKSNMILQGVARQILSKCGARLWWVEIPESLPLPAVFVGIDVFHAPVVYDPKTKRNGRKNSVAAVIVEVILKDGTNSSLELYSKTFCREGGKEYFLKNEIESTLQEALHERNVIPGCVIVWRDGMPDTATLHAKDEIDGVRNGIRTSVPGAKGKSENQTPIAYIVCQKRISTKFMTPDGQKGAPPGTLVTSLQGEDEQITTFYLNGRAPSYSTPKPVRYLCMQCDKGLQDVLLEELTWQQCHAYPNWTGPIKVPSVCQQAHKLAKLAGGFVDGGETINCKKFRNRPHYL